MKIAIISDIHENAHNLILFLNDIKHRDVAQIICLGDLINAGIARILALQAIPVTTVWGNNDGERVAITALSLEEKSNLTVGFDTFDILEFGGRKIFITHYTMLAKPMAQSGEFDAVFYGHDHKKNIDHVDTCLVVNPGELAATRSGSATYALYDTLTNTADIMTLHNSISLQSDIVDAYRKNNMPPHKMPKKHIYK